MSDAVSILGSAVRDVENFPQEGIVFKDITPILSDPGLFGLSVAELIKTADGQRVDKIVGIDARGFIFGAPVAHQLRAGFVPIRKKGKLPWQTIESAYTLEYGEAVVEVHADAISAGENVLLVDDLLATGGTAAAAIKLLQQLGANLIGVSFLIELSFLEGRGKLDTKAPIHSILSY